MVCTHTHTHTHIFFFLSFFLLLVGGTPRLLPYVSYLNSVISQLIRKDSDAGKEWRQEDKGTTEDEMIGWHH